MDTVASEIENWVAWCWLGEDPSPQSPGRCYSAEGRYIPPATLDDEGRLPRRIICHQRAKRVQEVFDRLELLTRQVIRFEYTQRSMYDIWEQQKEIGSDGELRKVWVCIDNNRRMKARLHLGISREQYREHVETFKESVREAFDCEVCEGSY